MIGWIKSSDILIGLERRIIHVIVWMKSWTFGSGIIRKCYPSTSVMTFCKASFTWNFPWFVGVVDQCCPVFSFFSSYVLCTRVSPSVFCVCLVFLMFSTCKFEYHISIFRFSFTNLVVLESLIKILVYLWLEIQIFFLSLEKHHGNN